MARSYAQFCGLARALDVVGERWTLLIVRELLVRPARYGELAVALPGIASNLLADRLRSLVTAGVVERRADGDRGEVYALTPWGAQLEDAVGALVRWSAPLMRPGPGPDAFRPEWLLVALGALLRHRTASDPATVGLETGGTALTLRLDQHGPHVSQRIDEHAAAVLSAEPHVLLGLASGELSVDEAVARGQLRGDRAALRRVFQAGRDAEV